MAREYWVHEIVDGSIKMTKITLQKLRKEVLKSLPTEDIIDIAIERAEQEKRNKQLEHAIEFLKEEVWK